MLSILLVFSVFLFYFFLLFRFSLLSFFTNAPFPSHSLSLFLFFFFFFPPSSLTLVLSLSIWLREYSSAIEDESLRKQVEELYTLLTQTRGISCELLRRQIRKHDNSERQKKSSKTAIAESRVRAVYSLLETTVKGELRRKDALERPATKAFYER